MNYLDRIILKGMEFYGYHGVFSGEQELGQRFLVDLEITYQAPYSGYDDKLENAVDYSSLFDLVKEIVCNERYNLIETLAERIAEKVREDYPVEEVLVRVKKPHAPLKGVFSYVSVEVKRGGLSGMPLLSETSRRYRAFVGLGSNMGDRAAYLEKARKELESSSQVKIVKASSLYESEPVGYLNQGWFLNQVVQIETALYPHDLLRLLLNIEDSLGRKREIRWGPRAVDLDLLLFEDWVLSTPELVVPHPHMYERNFVLIPLNEIASELRHPDGKTTQEHLRAFHDSTPGEKIRVYQNIEQGNH